jgi:hypothetical protein
MTALKLLNLRAALDRYLLQLPGGHEHQVRKSAAVTNGKMDQREGCLLHSWPFTAIRPHNISQRVLI